MSVIADALAAADERKSAAGLIGPGIVYSPGVDADRAIFSGFDIDHDELHDVLNSVSLFFWHRAHELGLVPLFGGCWADGFLVGLIAGKNSVAPHHDPPPRNGGRVTLEVRMKQWAGMYIGLILGVFGAGAVAYWYWVQHYAESESDE